LFPNIANDATHSGSPGDLRRFSIVEVRLSDRVRSAAQSRKRKTALRKIYPDSANYRGMPQRVRVMTRAAKCGEREGLWRPLEASADLSIFPRMRGVSFTRGEEPPPRCFCRQPGRTKPIRLLSQVMVIGVER